jgi:hypothetical protein
MPAVRIGRRVRIKRSDFDRLVEQSYSPGQDRAFRRALGSIWEGAVPSPEPPEA